MGDSRCGLCFRFITLCAVISCLIGRRIDLIERLSSGDIATFDKVTMQDNAANLRANFRYAVS